jgi:hypothetical protein
MKMAGLLLSVLPLVLIASCGRPPASGGGSSSWGSGETIVVPAGRLTVEQTLALTEPIFLCGNTEAATVAAFRASRRSGNPKARPYLWQVLDEPLEADRWSFTLEALAWMATPQDVALLKQWLDQHRAMPTRDGAVPSAQVAVYPLVVMHLREVAGADGLLRRMCDVDWWAFRVPKQKWVARPPSRQEPYHSTASTLRWASLAEPAWLSPQLAHFEADARSAGIDEETLEMWTGSVRSGFAGHRELLLAEIAADATGQNASLTPSPGSRWERLALTGPPVLDRVTREQAVERIDRNLFYRFSDTLSGSMPQSDPLYQLAGEPAGTKERQQYALPIGQAMGGRTLLELAREARPYLLDGVWLGDRDWYVVGPDGQRVPAPATEPLQRRAGELLELEATLVLLEHHRPSRPERQWRIRAQSAGRGWYLVVGKGWPRRL